MESQRIYGVETKRKCVYGVTKNPKFDSGVSKMPNYYIRVSKMAEIWYKGNSVFTTSPIKLSICFQSNVAWITPILYVYKALPVSNSYIDKVEVVYDDEVTVVTAYIDIGMYEGYNKMQFILF